ncbi:hypothetical protein AQUCO_00800255v1 [Aquilegia coerulea]|uniref:Uncharacterized protein n=1 Tax=Aquilegia coerulea TaxID=218851 RepID=A0A2G5EI20_AQUCA|nr:hypothetical protein AQUCO_00800255v1 [Aquilegia coerulea]
MKTELIALKDDVNGKLHTARIDRGEVPTHVVEYWLKNVQRILEDTELIEGEFRTSKKCLNGLLPKCCSNLTLGQRISKLIIEGTTLTLTGSQLLKDTLTSQVPKIGVELPTQKLVGETTAHKSLEKVWELLMDGESRVVGVYGMGRIGKTKMAVVINNRILAKPDQFDKIIWVTLSKARDIHGLQIDIAKKFDLDLSKEQDELERMGKLHEALKRRKRILFILDDMWQEFSLGQIGIPEPTTDNGCKVLLTTRKKEVCNKMGCRAAIVKVETLTEEEAWELFLDEVDELTPEVMPTAKLVAKECSGLPLAIITAGSPLQVLPSKVEWEEVLERASFMKNRIDGEDIVFERLKFSYDRLPNEKLRKVLDLRCDWDKENSRLLLLPDSISDLVNLHDLRLSWCTKLKKVPSLAKLVRLRSLELNNTAIEELPEGMEMLGKLSCLNLHVVKLRAKIPMGLISKLSTLQELYLGGIEVDKLYDVGSGESFANELLSLKELENLNTSFHCLSDYASYVGSSKFNGLKDLKFWNLPKLKSIWRGVMICNSLEMVGIRNCSELKRLPQFKGAEQSTPPASLKAIEGSRECWDLLEWDPAFPQNILQPFFYEWDPTYASK